MTLVCRSDEEKTASNVMTHVKSIMPRQTDPLSYHMPIDTRCFFNAAQCHKIHISFINISRMNLNQLYWWKFYLNQKNDTLVHFREHPGNYRLYYRKWICSQRQCFFKFTEDKQMSKGGVFTTPCFSSLKLRCLKLYNKLRSWKVLSQEESLESIILLSFS